MHFSESCILESPAGGQQWEKTWGLDRIFMEEQWPDGVDFSPCIQSVLSHDMAAQFTRAWKVPQIMETATVAQAGSSFAVLREARAAGWISACVCRDHGGSMSRDLGTLGAFHAKQCFESYCSDLCNVSETQRASFSIAAFGGESWSLTFMHSTGMS